MVSPRGSRGSGELRARSLAPSASSGPLTSPACPRTTRSPSIGTRRDRLGDAGLEPDAGSGRPIELHAPGRRAIEAQGAVDLEEVGVAAHLDIAVAGVDHVDGDRGQLGEDFDVSPAAMISPGTMSSSTDVSPGAIGSNSAMSLVPSAKTHSM